MRVLVISAALPPMQAGEADHALHLSRRLAERGLAIRVLTTCRSEPHESFPFEVDDRMVDWSWKELPRLWRSVKKFRPEGILLLYSGWTYGGHPMITYLPALLKMFSPKVSFVTQFETEYEPLHASLPVRAALKTLEWCAGPQRCNYILGTLLNASDHLVVLSERHRARIVEQFPTLAAKSLVIPPPPILPMAPEPQPGQRDRLRQSLGLAPDDFILAYYGYVYPGKGVETLIDVVRLLRQRQSRARLVVVGGGINLSNLSPYAQSLFDKVEQLGLTDSITWTGEYQWDSPQPSSYLFAADACVLPFDEGVTLNRSSLAAAVTHGLPIVTTRAEPLESAFVDGQNVILCQPKDSAAMVRAIESLMENPSLRLSLRQGAVALADEWFSWRKAVNRTIELLSQQSPLHPASSPGWNYEA